MRQSAKVELVQRKQTRHTVVYGVEEGPDRHAGKPPIVENVYVSKYGLPSPYPAKVVVEVSWDADAGA